MSYKKYLIIASIGFILIFPEEFFSGFVGVMIILIMLLLIIEVGLDIYLIVVFLIRHYKEKDK